MKYKQPVNILMLDRYLTVGGVATYLKTLCRGMIEKGHSVYLITAADDDNRQIRDEFASYGIHILTIPNTESRIITAYRFVKGIYRFLKEYGVDIIHSHHRLVNFTGMIVSKLCKIPHLITLHVFKDDHKLLTKLLKHEWVTVPSKALKKHLIRYYGLKEERVDIIYNSISSDYKIDDENKTSLQKAIFNDSGKFYVGYIGRISHEKGVDILVESIPLVKKKYPGVEFRIFGDGAELTTLKQRCSELRLDPDKIFMGPTSYVNEALSLIDICVIPSRSESFSLFALECMRAQKPVIASGTGGIPEVIEHEETGLLMDDESPKALAQCILTLYDNKELCNTFARNGYKRFLDTFPLEKFYSSYEDEYRSLIEMP